mmetsp:Transcript_2527/g.3653  ORF Transcript_2527/g.3653 Transcript_2527/m.3653 type:complete len:574 (+) Transcript_2527:79-1800(+)
MEDSKPRMRESMINKCLGSRVPAIEKAKVLVVGAGGVGCELLKNLVLTGFKNLEVIDLDTIDLSNLNRQFLFRHEHIGMSKSKVARESVLRFNPECKIISYHGNIKDQKFSASYFEKFDIVMNALDNLGARQHVNRLCLATKKPLIESGTQGYLGQVNPIIPGKTACFECTPPPAQKTYAVCTIRSTPDKPVHCVVWAKHIFAVLFGPKDKDNMLSDLEVKDMFTTANGEEPYEKRAFRKFFYDEIVKLLRKEDTDFKGRIPPKPLKLDELLKESKEIPSSSNASSLRDQRVLRLSETAEDFLTATRRFILERKSEIGQASFDKDDDLAMEFVTAVANLRMHIYGIPRQSKFTIKGIAGNIIHAIATTNAIAAGLMVMEAIKIVSSDDYLTNNKAKIRNTWIKTSGPMLLQTEECGEPHKDCVVCGDAMMSIQIDKKTFTLQKFYQMLRDKLGMIDPGIDILSGTYYGNLEDNDEKILIRPLHSLPGFIDGAQLSVEDQDQNFSFNLIVYLKDLDEEKFPDGFSLTTSEEALKKAKETNMERLGMGKGQKRKAYDLSTKEPPSKAQKVVIDVL